MNAKSVIAGILGSAFLLLLLVLLVPSGASWPAAAPVPAAIGAALWNERTYEVLLQGMVILAGVLSILLLLGSRKSGRMQP
jgi:hypothetical protein